MVEIEKVEMPYKEYVISDKVDESLAYLSNYTARRVRYKFPNGYGASVVMGNLFYSDEGTGLYELCPMKDNALWYDAVDPSNNDVYGYLNDEELYILLTKILTKEK